MTEGTAMAPWNGPNQEMIVVLGVVGKQVGDGDGRLNVRWQ